MIILLVETKANSSLKKINNWPLWSFPCDTDPATLAVHSPEVILWYPQKYVDSSEVHIDVQKTVGL